MNQNQLQHKLYLFLAHYLNRQQDKMDCYIQLHGYDFQKRHQHFHQKALINLGSSCDSSFAETEIDVESTKLPSTVVTFIFVVPPATAVRTPEVLTRAINGLSLGIACISWGNSCC